MIDFDPKDRQGNPLNEIKHKVIFLSVKYVDENTPEMYRDWLSAIKESLTGQIDESNYARPELQKVIEAIAKNLVSPEEKYRMIEEFNFEEDKRKQFAEGEKVGIEKGIARGMTKGVEQEKLQIAKNLLPLMSDDEISEITGLTVQVIAPLRETHV